MYFDFCNLVHWACEYPNLNILRECIEMKYDLNEENIFAYNSLMLAVRQPNTLNIIKLLVNNGVDLNHGTYWRDSVISLSKHDEYVWFLQSIGARRLDDKEGMSKLAIEILNNNASSPTTKEAVNQIDARGLTPFLWAIFHDRENYIDTYMKLGADVNQQGKNGITPLMMAVLRHNLNLVKKLVENGANINQLNNSGLLAVVHSHWDNRMKILDYLFENGAKTDPCPSGSGKSLLGIAALQNCETDFDYFLNKNANINFIDSNGNSVLSYAILNGNTRNAEKLIARGADVNACGPNGKTPLAWAVFLNNPKIIQFLLDKGAAINQTDYKGRTALYYAQKYFYSKIVKLLIEKGATFEICVENLNIFSAIQAKNLDSIKQLLDNLNIYDKNEKNETVIDVAIQVGDLDIINLLLEKENYSFVHTALPTAIQTKNTQLVKLFLEKGANVNRIYKKTNQSPLSQAISQKDAHMVELLLKLNANVKTNEDPLPFQRALQTGQGKIVKMLIENVDDINELQNGNSLLQMAIHANNLNVIMFLLEKGADPTNVLDRLKGLAKKFEELEIVLDNVLGNFNQENDCCKTTK